MAQQYDERARTDETGWFGLNVFSDRTTPAKRRRYLLHAAVYVLALLPTIWPLLAPFNRVEPYVLGMPFNMAVAVASIVVVFANTVALYRLDHGSLME